MRTSAQVNSWINPTSGSWDDPASWSLGALPDSSQSVMITNSGWKAVAINPSTPVNFPAAMTVSDLTVRGATNTENTLLLNYYGTAVPLTVLNGLTLQDDGRILNFSSALDVPGGTLLVTNAQMIQDGGFIRATNVLLQNAVYYLTNGDFEAASVSIGSPVSARFIQYGGTVTITNLDLISQTAGAIENGISLYDGMLNLPGGMYLTGGSGGLSYFQAGGTNQTTDIPIEPGYAGRTPTFTLNGGLLADNSMTILSATDSGATTVNQNGGSHVITNTLSIQGGSQRGYYAIPATYNLNGGTLSARLIDLDADQGDSVYVQSNGITSVETLNAHSVGYYGQNNTTVILESGTLTCSNYIADDGGGRLIQSGGALIVGNLLDFGGFRQLGPPPSVYFYGTYTFTGGTLSASNINITGVWIIGDGSTNRISNPGIFSLSHTLQISNAVEQLGSFILGTNATIDLAGSASQLSFANSSGETWAGGAVLVVSNWNGSPSGGGGEQLRFGTDGSGLTPAELSQVQFSLGTNLYSAKILSTGEVVPGQPVASASSVAFSTQGNQLVLTWPQGWSLQSATNVSGPYVDISGATSPYTNEMISEPQRFFRLRQ